MIPLSPEQLAAYANAVYEVETDGGWVDASAFAVDADGLPATLISACNPWSQRLSDAENAARHQALQRQIEADGCRWWPARGRSPDHDWVEPGFLVWAAEATVDAWARGWQQHAVLVLPDRPDQPTLRIYSPFAGTSPPSRLANVRVEWVGCGPPASP